MATDLDRARLDTVLDEAALAAAHRQLNLAVTFNEALHPRDANGHWRKTLQEHADILPGLKSKSPKKREEAIDTARFVLQSKGVKDAGEARALAEHYAPDPNAKKAGTAKAGTIDKPALVEMDSAAENSASYGDVTKKKFAVHVDGQQVGVVRHVQHRNRQGGSYTTGWTNDFSEWMWYPGETGNKGRGRDTRLPNQAHTKTEAIQQISAYLKAQAGGVQASALALAEGPKILLKDKPGDNNWDQEAYERALALAREANGRAAEGPGVLQEMASGESREDQDLALADGPKKKLADKPGDKNWVAKAGGLPDYIKRIAEHIKGENPSWSDGRAIASAVNTVKRWCSGGQTSEGGTSTVSAATKAKACAAVASWEAKKASSGVKASVDGPERLVSYEGMLLSVSDVAQIRLIDGDVEFDHGKYVLALAVARRETGAMHLATGGVINFDPDKHPRNTRGQFAKILGGLEPGGAAHLPDGTAVSKRAGGDFLVDGKVRADAKHAADSAIIESAAKDHPASIGGSKQYIPEGKDATFGAPAMHQVNWGNKSNVASHASKIDKRVHADQVRNGTPGQNRASEPDVRDKAGRDDTGDLPDGAVSHPLDKGKYQIPGMPGSWSKEALQRGDHKRADPKTGLLPEPAKPAASQGGGADRQELKDMTDESFAPEIDKMTDDEVRAELQNQLHEAGRAGEGGGDIGYGPGISDPEEGKAAVDEWLGNEIDAAVEQELGVPQNQLFDEEIDDDAWDGAVQAIRDYAPHAADVLNGQFQTDSFKQIDDLTIEGPNGVQWRFNPDNLGGSVVDRVLGSEKTNQ